MLGIYGCSVSPSRAPKLEKKQALLHAEVLNISHRKALAKELYEEKDYYASLTQWRILRTIDPDNAEYINRIRVMEVLIKRRIKTYLVQGKEALTAGDLKQAQFYLLKALALDPTNFSAMKMMREIEFNHVEEVQVAKTRKLMRKQQRKFEAEEARKNRQQAEEEMVSTANDQPEEEASEQEKFYLEMGTSLFKKGDWGGAIREIDKYLSSNKSTPSIENILMKAYANMSARFEKRGHWEPAIQNIEFAINYANNSEEVKKLELKHNELKLKAAEYYYIEGVKVYRTNIDRAIEYWKQAVALNPQHTKARDRLEKAIKDKQNLQLKLSMNHYLGCFLSET